MAPEDDPGAAAAAAPHPLFAADGPLAALPGYAPRSEQQTMAGAVQAALDRRGTLLVEAGTGVGKTFAYLVPAMDSGLKVIVSTGTRNLQDQLYHRDIPLVRDALGISLRIALLKGRANYLCRHRLQLALGDGRHGDPRTMAELERIRVWAGRTRSGDIAEVTDVREQSPVWPRVTSTADNCLGQECPDYGDCWVLAARRAAQEADLVVINHHLFCADLALREEGFGELLPGADAFVFDEAHQLPETAGEYFGTAIGGRQILDLARDARLEHLAAQGLLEDLPPARDALESAVAALHAAFGAGSGRLGWAEALARPGAREALDAVREHLAALGAWLHGQASRGKGLARCADRCTELGARLGMLLGAGEETDVASEGAWTRWVEQRRRSFSLRMTPLDVADSLREGMRAHPAAWIFTSATLAVKGDFEHFRRRLGIESADTLALDSPFDYARNALLYLPTGLPEPSSAHYTRAVVEAALPVIRAAGGCTFLLFTSLRALGEAAELLRKVVEFPLMVQGEAPRAELLRRFRAAGDGVLLGSHSFWEGVDVRGEALSCVVIDRLPFASPGDPVLAARIDRLRREGGNPFRDYQLPQAVLQLKQGVGRLIRDVDDRGVMMLCDPRIRGRSYGRVFLSALPPLTRTGDLERVTAFLRRGRG